MILLTRPEDSSLRTKARLEASGYEVLADPLLTLRFSPPRHLINARPDAVVITSANGAHAVKGHEDLCALQSVPAWTVGGRTTAAVRELGFSVMGEASDVAHLAALLRDRPPQTILYLAAENRAADLTQLLPRHQVETRIVYSAVPSTALAAATVEVLRGRRITHVLHYSRRLAETYLELAEAADISAEALAPAQLCLSEQVAAPLLEAGALEVAAAGEPKEDALIALLGRPLSSPSGGTGVR